VVDVLLVMLRRRSRAQHLERASGPKAGLDSALPSGRFRWLVWDQLLGLMLGLLLLGRRVGGWLVVAGGHLGVGRLAGFV